MKPTQQDKEAFFALYWGQNVHHYKLTYSKPVDGHNSTGYLKLKSLSSISDEDAIEVMAILNGLISTESMRINPESLLLSIVRMDGMASLKTFDFLRKQSYLLPFRNFTTDDILSFGWAVITTK